MNIYVYIYIRRYTCMCNVSPLFRQIPHAIAVSTKDYGKHTGHYYVLYGRYTGSNYVVMKGGLLLKGHAIAIIPLKQVLTAFARGPTCNT